MEINGSFIVDSLAKKRLYAQKILAEIYCTLDYRNIKMTDYIRSCTCNARGRKIFSGLSDLAFWKEPKEAGFL